MTDLDQRRRRRPGVAFAGSLVPLALLSAVVLAYRSDFFADRGWRGGEYAYAFIGVAIGSVVVGLALKLLRPPWGSVGTGVALGGTLGVVVVIALVALFAIVMSQFSPTP